MRHVLLVLWYGSVFDEQTKRFIKIAGEYAGSDKREVVEAHIYPGQRADSQQNQHRKYDAQNMENAGYKPPRS